MPVAILSAGVEYASGTLLAFKAKTATRGGEKEARSGNTSLRSCAAVPQMLRRAARTRSTHVGSSMES